MAGSSLSRALAAALLCACMLAKARGETGLGVPNLPFGDVNVVVLTDVHSWLGGHQAKEPHFNADYGHVLSFYERLKAHCDENNMDLWFVMNGDWIDGTGLSLNGDPSYLIPLLQKMPWDAVNVGNHELYASSVIEYVTRPGGFIDWWGERYLSSNIYLNGEHKKLLGNKYNVMRGKNSDVLVFGFIYNLGNPSELVTVQSVQSAVSDGWFRKALTTETYDAILVLAHMGCNDELVQVILKSIRSHVKDARMPVQFLTGHTHERCANLDLNDDWSTSIEAGRYLDTVGFVSFPTIHTARTAVRRQLQSTNSTDLDDVDGSGGGDGDGNEDGEGEGDNSGGGEDESDNNGNQGAGDENGEDTNGDGDVVDSANGDGESNSTETGDDSGNGVDDNPIDQENGTEGGDGVDEGATSKSNAFQYRFLDANQKILEDILGVDSLLTKSGSEFQTFIQRTRGALGLSKSIGCAPQDYFYNRSLDEKDALWALYVHQVVPTQLIRDDPSKVILVSQESWRYDLFQGENTFDDIVAVSPFNDTVVFVGEIPGDTVFQLNETLNAGNDGYLSKLPFFILAGSVTKEAPVKLYTHLYETERILDAMKKFYDFKGTPEPTNMTSTSMWTEYVASEWNCDSGVKIPPWLGGDGGKFFEKEGSDGVSITKVAIALGIVSIVLVLMVCFIRWLLRQAYHGIDRSSVQRLTSIDEDEDYEDKDLDEDEEDVDANGNELL